MFQGDKVVLTLTPVQGQMPKKKAAKEPHMARALPEPDPHGLSHEINRGRTPSHATRLPISAQYVQMMIRNTQAAMNLHASGTSWSLDANDGLLELLLKPKQQRRKMAAIVDDEGGADMLGNNIPQNNLNEMEPVVAEVPNCAYAKNNEKDDVTKRKAEKEDVNKHGAIKDDMDEAIYREEGRRLYSL